MSALTALKEDPETAKIPVVMISMHADSDLGQTLGAVEFMRKPIDRERLKGILIQLLSG